MTADAQLASSFASFRGRSWFVLGAVAVGACATPAPTASPSAPSAGRPTANAARSEPADAASAQAIAAENAPGFRAPQAYALPGVTAPAFLDYLAVDRSRGRVWLPVANTGSVDVFDVATRTFTRIDGFKTEAREAGGRKRLLGPSAVFVTGNVAFIANRATSEVCSVDADTAKVRNCTKLAVPTDGVAYVASQKEVWVTTPRDKSITVVDASRLDVLNVKATITTEGEPEGYAIDETGGTFFTNLEDKNRTLAIDVKTHQVTASWDAGCGTEGPRGLVIDSARHFVVVACTDHVQVLDAAHGGRALGKLETGAGVDNLDYLEGESLLYVAAGKAALLTVARLDAHGSLTTLATAKTSAGARNAVVDARGNAYVVDPASAQLLVFER